jgi:hypothetical protein
VQHPNRLCRHTLPQGIGDNAGDPAQVRPGHVSVVSDGGTGQMATTNPIDDYLATLDEPKRASLTLLGDTIMATVPDAEQYHLSDRRAPDRRRRRGRLPCS